MGNPTGKGGFKKGQSGNPGGRPAVLKEVRELAQSYTSEAIETWREIMRNKKAPAQARVAASCALMDRAWGKPETKAEINSNVNYVARVPAAPESIEEWERQNQDLIATTAQ